MNEKVSNIFTYDLTMIRFNWYCFFLVRCESKSKLNICITAFIKVNFTHSNHLININASLNSDGIKIFIQHMVKNDYKLSHFTLICLIHSDTMYIPNKFLQALHIISLLQREWSKNQRYKIFSPWFVLANDFMQNCSHFVCSS